MNIDKKKHIRAHFEDRAVVHGGPIWWQALVSIAISLKRLADKPSLTEGISPDMHNSILHTAWEAGRNFQHGVNQEK